MLIMSQQICCACKNKWLLLFRQVIGFCFYEFNISCFEKRNIHLSKNETFLPYCIQFKLFLSIFLSRLIKYACVLIYIIKFNL